ncbi:MAG: tyrosine-type recombinase/integrase [Eubacterium sp.]|nr:tyrosine-type recombinase/integrase [Eubacterium sp.]
MGTTEPIRDKEDLKNFLNYYRNVRPSPRNYAMTVIGLHTALRISDILNLKWKDVYHFQKNCFLKHICLCEKKTGKQSSVAMNQHVKEALETYRNTRRPKPDHYIFSKTTDNSLPICRSQAYRIIKKAAEETVCCHTHISCHSLRKTFGYHAWKQGISPVLLMDIFNHSSFDVTKRYLGIGQDERDSIFLKNFY